MTYARRSRTAKNIAAVSESVEEQRSIPCLCLELGIPQTIFHRILHNDLGIKTYKVQLTQQIKSAGSNCIAIEKSSSKMRRIST